MKVLFDNIVTSEQFWIAKVLNFVLAGEVWWFEKPE